MEQKQFKLKKDPEEIAAKQTKKESGKKPKDSEDTIRKPKQVVYSNETITLTQVVIIALLVLFASLLAK